MNKCSFSDLYRTTAYRFVYPGVAALLASTMLLSSCSRHETTWTPVKAPAPLIAAGQPATVYQQCQGNNHACVYAFGLRSGDRLLTEDLVKLLDSTLDQAQETRNWPMSGNQKQQFPYQFTVLSIDPTIAVGYPVAQGPYTENACSGIFPRGNCLPSQRFNGYYRISTSMPNRSGLVWFSPEHGNRLFSVPQHANSIFFMINGHEARLKRTPQAWLFNRVQS